MSSTRRFAAVFLCALGSGCTAERAPATGTPQAGTVNPVPGEPLPEGHPNVPIASPASTGDHVGRAPRRLTAAQLRAALTDVTGATWTDRRTVIGPELLRGIEYGQAHADMLEALAPTLGRADYRLTTVENVDPSVTFTKLAEDAARSACRGAVDHDLAELAAGRSAHLLNHLTAGTDTPASNPTGAHQTIEFMALRFWSRIPTDDEQTRFGRLFDAAMVPGDGGPAPTNADGWRAICIAMASSPEFLTY